MIDLPDNDGVAIRRMTIDDLEQVHAIDVLSFALPWPSSSYRFELLENPASLSWVAETILPGGKRRVVGMSVIWLVKDEAHIATIAIHPDFRGRGIGRKLLAEVLRESIAGGAKQATLEVRANNVVAQNLYKDFGFEVVNRRLRYYSDNNEDALMMTVNDLDEDYLDWLDEAGDHRTETSAH
ncbi:MAG: ribosomal protein S18-alanine N-acetyltransferase [Omnitrophica WOR_2 bacterium]